MSDLFDFEKPPALYAVMGNPVGHSRSPEIHHCFAAQCGLRIEYQKIHVDVGGFVQAVSGFQAVGGQGLNITVPFKLEAWQLCEQRSERAELAGAVNTLWFRGSEVHGDNTDGVGLCTDITSNLGQELRDKSILILGAGGAVRGVLGEFLGKGASRVVIANRTVDKAIDLARRFEAVAEVQGCGLNDLQGLKVDIVINGTAASLSGEMPDLPPLDWSDNALAYDMMYGSEPTPFMRWATDQHAAVVSDGFGMLVEQAAQSFRIWHGVLPETAPVIQKLRP